MFDNLGKALGLIRELREKSQAQVAREAGIGKSQLSKYERGKELPKFESLKKVLRVLEIGPFEIFYTMHLIDMQAEGLDLGVEARRQGLPPLALSGKGFRLNGTDVAFKRLIDDVMSLYNSLFLEKLANLPRKH